MATLLLLWILLGVALPAFLGFYATRHRIRWLMWALLAACAALVAATVWTLTVGVPAEAEDLAGAQSLSAAELDRIILLVMLIYGAAGTALGLLVGWLAGRTLRTRAERAATGA